MKIFIQSSAFLPTPAGGAGAVEYIVARLAAGLALKHDVTLFALEGSDVPGVKLVTVNGAGNAPNTEARMVVAMVRETVTDGFPDVIFDHSLTMLAQRTIDCPSVSMCHGMGARPEWARNWVFTSQHHGTLQGVPDGAPLWLGVDLAEIPQGKPHNRREPYLFWAGRILAYKQPHFAIDVAHAADLPIVLAGPIVDSKYAEEHLNSRLHRIRTGGHTVEMLGEVDHDEVLRRMREARAFLFTSDHTEPAGLVMLEAMASGCPVIAFDHGANRQYLGDMGIYMQRTVNSAVSALLGAVPLSAAQLRARVKEHFTIKQMVNSAEGYLRRAVAGERW